MTDIILASGSKAKLEILQRTGLVFRVEESSFDESNPPSQDPIEVVKYLALGKARLVAKGNPDAVVIGADTIIYHQNRIIGKPQSETEARTMLKSYCGQAHRIYTGIAVVHGDKELCDVSTVDVTFRNLGDDEINNYVSTGEPFGKAGSYAYQDRGAVLIKKMEGDYHAAQGMPVFKLCTLLKQIGVKLI